MSTNILKMLSILALSGSVSALGADSTPPQSPAAPLRVAFVLSDHFAMIDFAGPWEVFADTTLPGTSKPSQPGYDLYTVAASTTPVHSEAGALLLPQFTFQNAPPPDLIIIGAQSDHSPQLMAWLNKNYTDGVTLASICLGADQLATAGLLDGRKATTHHDFVARFRSRFPTVQWLANRRFVEVRPKLYTAGGLSSGIDLALHLVSEQYGQPAALKTAQLMEYSSEAWKTSAAP